ncbi:MAG: DUF2845 domain-containing protein [Smithella sp.]
MKFSLFVFLVICSLLISVTNSHAFRCGNDIVSRYDTAASAQAKCGNPFQYGSGTENIKGVNQYVRKWFYNCGENDFIYSISIYNGIIVKIDTVDRGTGEGQCQ